MRCCVLRCGDARNAAAHNMRERFACGLENRFGVVLQRAAYWERARGSSRRNQSRNKRRMMGQWCEYSTQRCALLTAMNLSSPEYVRISYQWPLCQIHFSNYSSHRFVLIILLVWFYKAGKKYRLEINAAILWNSISTVFLTLINNSAFTPPCVALKSYRKR